MDIDTYMQELCEGARRAARVLASQSTDTKNAILSAMADSIDAEREYILTANAEDLAHGRERGLTSAMLDRLELTEKRMQSMTKGLRDAVALPDPVGAVLDQRTRPSGITITKVRVPLGVIGIIYESRPNVTADAAALCVKAGNVVVLRGGSEAFRSNKAIAAALQRALVQLELPQEIVSFVETTDRAAVDYMLKAEGLIDVIVPRGGESLVRKVAEMSRVPVLKHYDGICHTYIAPSADVGKAVAIALNAKCQRPGVCNAMETLLIDEEVAEQVIAALFPKLVEAGVELRGCERTRELYPEATPATEEDWRTEYLDLILAVKIVDGVDEAIEFINTYGSHHSDAIVAEDAHEAAHFLHNVDSATVYVNASTRFTDGAEFGMGAEIGISTDKLHARGPVGLEELTTYKYLIRGDGTIRE